MTEMVGIIVEFKIVLRPDTGTFQTNWRNFSFYNGVARLPGWVWALRQFKFTGFGNCKGDIGLALGLYSKRYLINEGGARTLFNRILESILA